MGERKIATQPTDEIKRRCRKCQEVKNLLSDFVKSKSCKHGRAWTCLDCHHKQQAEWYEKNKKPLKEVRREYARNNKEAARNRNRKYRKANRDKINSRRRELRLQNIEERRKKDRAYYQANTEKELLKHKKYRLKNKEKIAEYSKEYREKNSEKIKEIRRKHRPRQKELDKIRRKTDPQWRLKRTISNYIYQTLKGRKLGKHWEGIVGYKLEDLKKHLEKQFDDGMTWDNYGEWHIDHKIPVAVFNFTEPEHEDFKRCWALKNLQPLWAKENLIKGTKIEKPFQPSLPI